MRKLRYFDVTDPQLLDAQALVDECASRGFEVDMGSVITAWRKYSQQTGTEWVAVTDAYDAFWHLDAYLSEVFD